MSKKIQGKSFFGGKKTNIKLFKKSLFVITILISIFYAAIFLLPVVPKNPNNPIAFTYKVKIKPQSSLSSIAEQLQQQGVFTGSIYFQLAAKAILVGSKLKPGSYLLPIGASLGKVLLQLAAGDRIRETIAIIPGMTIWQLRALVDAHPALTHKTNGMTSKEFLQAINSNYPSAEGIFLPDTYVFDPDETDINIYLRSSQAMQKQLAKVWKPQEGSPLKTPYELLILASIIEKETGKSSERGMISAVFTNRLRKGMPLQTDPTIIYGIGPSFDGNLRKMDLRRDSPYNSYMHKGLPPTPIAMPSKESLHAAMHPEQSNALYFVAKGDGSSHFSQDLKQHTEAVDIYQRKQIQK